MSNPLATPQLIEANGLQFAYHSLGQGPLLLLLHGFPDTARTWQSIQQPVASAGYRVVAPYLRGYSPTQVPTSDTTIDHLAGDVIGLIEAFNEQSAIVVGHDWGAAAAYAAAGLAPHRIDRLVTVALPHPAGFRPKPGDFWAARHFATFKLAAAPRRFVRRDFAGLKAIIRRWSPGWDFTDADLADVIRCLSNPESREAVFGYYRALQLRPADSLRHKIAPPTVAIAGEEDGAVPLRAFEEAKSRFTGDYQIVSMAGGHFPHREHPEQFLEHLLSALT